MPLYRNRLELETLRFGIFDLVAGSPALHPGVWRPKIVNLKSQFSILNSRTPISQSELPGEPERQGWNVGDQADGERSDAEEGQSRPVDLVEATIVTPLPPVKLVKKAQAKMATTATPSGAQPKTARNRATSRFGVSPAARASQSAMESIQRLRLAILTEQRLRWR